MAASSTLVKTLCLTLLVSVAGLGTDVAMAQFELTPMVGWASEIKLDNDEFGLGSSRSTRFDEGSSFGLVGDFLLGEHWMLEIALSQQESEIRRVFLSLPSTSATRTDIDVYEVGAHYRWAHKVFHPFVGVNLGQTRFDVQSRFSGGSDTFLSVAAIVGVRALADRRFGLRVDARYSTLFIDGDLDSPFCSFALCRTDEKDSTSDQLELRTGLVFRFGGGR